MLRARTARRLRARGAALLATAALLSWATAARAEADKFLARDGQVAPGEVYTDSDGAVPSDQPEADPWDVYVEEEKAPPEKERFELPGPFSLLRTTPQVQTVIAGPTYRNQKFRTEVGAGIGYVNAKWAVPFELSFEPTYRRNKNAPAGDRDFARFRTFGLAELWGRSSNWESTNVAATIFYDAQTSSFNELQVGASVSETIGRRLALSGNLVWGGTWPNGGDFVNAAVYSFGVSYNFGAGLRSGGFYEPHNNLFDDDDFGGFVSYQFLPFSEISVNAGKNQFVGVRLMFSYVLERP